IARQFLFDVYSYHVLELLQRSTHQELAGIAAKGFKEVRYHVRHSSEWMLRMGDGTEESHARVQKALDHLWRFTPEMFVTDSVDDQMLAAGAGADLVAVRTKWEDVVRDVVSRATLSLPADEAMMGGGRKGRHTEYLGRMLSEMQIVARSHPGAEW
ncbi:MAG: 1,2-phenylacetyl-CoA epoxidase subunit PaaC, partial [Gemmatimonadaceae bacterium]